MKTKLFLFLLVLFLLAFKQNTNSIENLLLKVFHTIDINNNNLIEAVVLNDKYTTGNSVHQLGVNGHDYFIGNFIGSPFIIEPTFENELAVVPSECTKYDKFGSYISVTLNYYKRKKCKKQFKHIKKMFREAGLKHFDNVKFKNKTNRGIKQTYPIQYKDWDYIHLIKKELNIDLKTRDRSFSISILLEKKCPKGATSID